MGRHTKAFIQAETEEEKKERLRIQFNTRIKKYVNKRYKQDEEYRENKLLKAFNRNNEGNFTLEQKEQIKQTKKEINNQLRMEQDEQLKKLKQEKKDRLNQVIANLKEQKEQQ